jgi:hypothetical protein
MDPSKIALILSTLAILIALASYIKKSTPGPSGPEGPTRSPSSPLCVNNSCLQENDITRFNSMYPSATPLINVVNRRPIIGVGSRVLPNTVGGTPENPQQLFPNDNYYYNPFGYNVPAPAPGATRKWRMYGVYSDGMTGGSGPVLQFNIGTESNWPTVSQIVKFQFPLTWGGVEGQTRDAYSNTIDDPVNKMHSMLFSYIPDEATGGKQVLWTYAELQALDVYP